MKKFILFLAGLMAFAICSMAQIQNHEKSGMSDTLMFEDWSSGSFATNQWMVDSSITVGWKMSTIYGNPTPSATIELSQFTNLSTGLTSRFIPGTNNYTELRYDVYFTDSSLVYAQMATEIYDGTVWHNIDVLDCTEGPFPWTARILNISDFCHNNFKIRFRFYTEGDYRARLNIDNILIGSFPLGIKEQETSDFMIRPNPAHSSIELILKNLENQKAQISILDLTGKAVYSEDFLPGSKEFVHKVNIENLRKGIYFCKIRSNQQELIRKLVVQ